MAVERSVSGIFLLSVSFSEIGRVQPGKQVQADVQRRFRIVDQVSHDLSSSS